MLAPVRRQTVHQNLDGGSRVHGRGDAVLLSTTTTSILLIGSLALIALAAVPGASANYIPGCDNEWGNGADGWATCSAEEAETCVQEMQGASDRTVGCATKWSV